MKLAISNLCWEEKFDDVMYRYLFDNNIALEVAASRIFKWENSKISGRPVSPYEKSDDAQNWYRIVHTHYGISVVSMQSLLYNIDVDIFSSGTYRRFLTDYLQSAVRFAANINCPNLSFGCAENRNIAPHISPDEAERIAIDFFGQLAEYASERKICISIEPIAKKFGTNFINYTEEAFELARKINNPGFKINLDTGAIIENGEDLQKILTPENLEFINHIHISEPGLMTIQKRDIHTRLAEIIRVSDYDGYISVVMLKFPEVKLIQGVMNYFISLFGS